MKHILSKFTVPKMLPKAPFCALFGAFFLLTLPALTETAFAQGSWRRFPQVQQMQVQQMQVQQMKMTVEQIAEMHRTAPASGLNGYGKGTALGAASRVRLGAMQYGQAQSNGLFSLGKAPRIKSRKEEKYLQGGIYIKTRQRFTVEKGSTAFQSSVLMSGLEGLVVREIRPVSVPHNSGALLASDAEGVGRIYAIRFDPSVDVKRLCDDLSRNPEIEYAEPMYIHKPLQERVTPTDPLFARQYHWARIEAERAWGISRGDTSVVIAICDSGVDYEHEDMRGNLWTNPGESGTDAMGRDRRSNGVDDDNNGKVDDWRGWDFVGNVTIGDLRASVLRPDNDPKARTFIDLDKDGEGIGNGVNHGSHVAGAAAAATDNGTGISGSGYRCRFLPIKQNIDDFLSSGGLIIAYEGILYAAQMGAKVVNCSWGGAGGLSRFEQDIINTATAMGVLVVAAAGNNGEVMDNDYTPASYDNVLSVGASDENDIPADFSNFGVKTSVFAPGVNILSTINVNRYVTESGTSMAAPIVSGIAALVRTLHPDWTAQQVIQQIRGTSDNVLVRGATTRPLGFFGRLNAFRALSVNRTLNGSGENLPGIVGAGSFIDAEGGVLTSFAPARLVLSLRNVLSDAADVSVTLTTLDGGLAILQPTVNIGNLATNQRREAEFTVQLQPIVAASAGSADFTDVIVTYRSGSYVNYERLTIFFELPIGGNGADIAVSPVTNFGTTPVSTIATVTITNTGNQNVRVTAATQAFTGANAGEFSQVDDLTGIILRPGDNTDRRIRFTPSTGATGQRTANFNITGVSDGVIAEGSSRPIAQGYSFSQRTEAYDEINDNNFPFASGGANIDDDERDVDLPFPFRFGQNTYTSVRLVSNGFLAFRPTGSATTQGALIDPIANAGYGADGVVSGFTMDLWMLPSGTIQYTTRGAMPNRVFIVQWKNASFWSAGNVRDPNTNLNFQIRLYESTNRIEFAYDQMSYALPNDFISGQVGLRGRNSDDFNSRTVDVDTHTWLTSVQSRSASAVCDIASDNTPPRGLVYVFTPADFAALSVPRVSSFQRSARLNATARSGGVIWTSPTATAGLNFNVQNRQGNVIISETFVTVGTTRVQTVAVANISPNTMTITGLEVTPLHNATMGEFRVLNQVPITLAPNSTTAIQVAFSPSVAGFREAAVRINYDGTSLLMPVFGNARAANNLLQFYTELGVEIEGAVNARFDRLPPFSITGTPPPLNLLRIGDTRRVDLISVRNMGTQPITVTGATFVQSTISTQISPDFTLLTPLPFTVQPGAQQQLSIRYEPRTAGERFAILRLLSDRAAPALLNCVSLGGLPRLVQVTPRTLNDVLNSVPQPYRFNVGTFNLDTTGLQRIVLRNSSTASTTVTGFTFGGDNPSDFSIAPNSPATPIRLANQGDSAVIFVRFRPGAVGFRSATMTVAYNQNPGSETVQLLGSGTARRRIVSFFDTQIFPVTAPGATSASLSMLVRSTGRDTVTIAGLSIEGADASQFRIQRNIPAGTNIAPLQTSTATVFFAPTSNGVKQARLAIRNNADVPVWFVELRGTASDSVARATVATLDATAQYGDEITVPIIVRGARSLPAGTTIYTSLRVNASLLEPLDAASTGEVFDNQRTVRLTLRPTGSDSIVARLRYRVVLGNDISTVLRLETASATNAIIRTSSGRLSVTGAPVAFLQIPAGQNSAEYSAQQSGTVSIPIVLRNRHRIPAGRFMFASITYNASLLEPTNLTSLLASNSVGSGFRTITFGIPQGSNADTVITPTFRAALGNATTTSISVVNTIQLLNANFGNLVSVQAPGNFTLTNVNRAGGIQQFHSARASLAIVQSSPNPASDGISLTFNTQEAGDITLTLSSTSGKPLYENTLANVEVGEHSLRVPVRELPSGAYILTLRSKAGMASQTVRVVR